MRAMRCSPARRATPLLRASVGAFADAILKGVPRQTQLVFGATGAGEVLADVDQANDQKSECEEASGHDGGAHRDATLLCAVPRAQREADSPQLSMLFTSA